MNLKEVKVLDENNIEVMTMVFNKISFNKRFSKNYFDLNTIISTIETKEEDIEVSLFEDSIYPLNIPDGTKLASEEKVDKSDGKRVIMTFEGDKPFLLVEETANVYDEMTIIPTNGEPYMLQDSYGILSTNSLSWTSAGIEYYLVSDVLNSEELIEVASSINVIPTMK